MKKWISLLFCVSIITSSVMTVRAAEDTTQFVEYAPQYTVMTRFDNAVSAVRSGSDYALISPNNKETAKINGEILGYSDHVTRIYRDGEIIFRSDAGVEFLSIAGIYAKPILNGIVAVQDDNFAYGLYNDKGELLLAHMYSNIIYGDGNCILLQSESGWTEYDISRNSTNGRYDTVFSSDEEYAICSVDGRYGVINYDGDVLIPFQFDKIGASGDTFIAYFGNTTSCYDMNGDVLYSNMNGICGAYSEEMFYNNEDDTHTYKSSSGRVMVNLFDIPEMQFGYPFYDGFAVIQASGKKTYINTSGTQLTEQMWDAAYRFSNGYALVMNRLADSNTGTYYNQWYIIDKNFEIVKILDNDVYIDVSYPASSDFSDGYIRTIDRDTGLMGFIRLDEFDFDDTTEFYTVSGAITSSDGDTMTAADDTITIILSNTDHTYTTTVESSGVNNTVNYRIEGIVAGTYTLTVSKKDHVESEYTVVVGTDEVTLDVRIYMVGDVNGDGVVNGNDIQRIYAHITGASSIIDSSMIKRADVNSDSVINGNDIQRIYAHITGTNSLF